MSRRRREPGPRRYARTERLNEVLREVIAEAIERLADSDERLGLLTVTGARVDPDLQKAVVYLSSLEGPSVVALDQHRARLQAQLGGQVHWKRTPRLTFAVDPAVVGGRKVEEALLRARQPTVDPPGDASEANGR